MPPELVTVSYTHLLLYVDSIFSIPLYPISYFSVHSVTSADDTFSLPPFVYVYVILLLCYVVAHLCSCVVNYSTYHFTLARARICDLWFHDFGYKTRHRRVKFYKTIPISTLIYVTLNEAWVMTKKGKRQDSELSLIHI